MRRTMLVMVAALATTSCDKLKAAAGSTFGADFEGEITMVSKPQNMQLTFGIKKPKYRIDTVGNVAPGNAMFGQGASLILDPPAKKGYALLPAQKKAFVLDFDKLKAQNQARTGAVTNQPPPKIEKTGKKEIIAGYECEDWKITTHDGKKSDLCAADGITWMDLGDLGWSSPEFTAAAVVSGMNRFPLRVVTYAANGAEEMRLEATKIDKKKLEDARFTVPPDYQIVDISQMLQGLPSFVPAKK